MKVLRKRPSNTQWAEQQKDGPRKNTRGLLMKKGRVDEQKGQVGKTRDFFRSREDGLGKPCGFCSSKKERIGEKTHFFRTRKRADQEKTSGFCRAGKTQSCRSRKERVGEKTAFFPAKKNGSGENLHFFHSRKRTGKTRGVGAAERTAEKKKTCFWAEQKRTGWKNKKQQRESPEKFHAHRSRKRWEKGRPESSTESTRVWKAGETKDGRESERAESQNAWGYHLIKEWENKAQVWARPIGRTGRSIRREETRKGRKGE